MSFICDESSMGHAGYLVKRKVRVGPDPLPEVVPVSMGRAGLRTNGPTRKRLPTLRPGDHDGGDHCGLSGIASGATDDAFRFIAEETMH
jgi:hypothetical protein